MTDPQRVLQGDSSRQLDPLLRAPHFPQNHVGFNEGELVLPLSRLTFTGALKLEMRSVFLIFLFYSAIFSIYLGLIDLNAIKFE